MSKKRKYNKLQEEEEKEIKLELPDLNFFGPSLDNKIQDNHVYFYSEVSTKSCINLITKLKDLEKKILSKYHQNNVLQEYIYLHINSYGGDIFSAFNIIDTIKNLKVPVVSIIEGCAASAATLISVCCDYRMMTPYSYMLIHELRSGMWGKFSDMELEMENLNQLMKRIKDIYKKHTNLTSSDLDEILVDDVWWKSTVCMKHKLVDETIKNKKTFSFNRDNLNL